MARLFNPPTSRARSALAGLCIAACAPIATAGIAVSLAVDDITGDDWSLAGIRIGIDSGAAGVMALDIAVDRVVLPQGQGDLSGLRLACQSARFVEESWHCEQGELQVDGSPYGPQRSRWTGNWRNGGRLSLEVAGLQLAGGKLGVSLATGDAGWQAGFDAYRLQLRRLSQLSGTAPIPPAWQAQGRISGRVDVRGHDGEARSARTRLVVDRLAYASPDGTQAAEDLALKIDGKARLRRAGWQFDSRLRWSAGALYSDPLFVDAGAGAVTLDASGLFDPARQRLRLDGWQVDLNTTLNVSGTGRLDLRTLSFDELTLAAHSDDAERLYQVLVQPFLIGTAADDLDVQGQVGFVLHFDSQGPAQAGLQLKDLAFSDRQGRYALRRTEGAVAWARDGDASVSRLDTDGVRIYRIESDPFAIRATFSGDRIDLVEPLVVPLLGGRVALDSFALRGALVEGEAPRWTADASVRAVSLEQLTRQLDWPLFNGDLSADLGRMRYADRQFSIGGGLELTAFGGAIRVDGLRIDDPLAAVPVLRADATLRGLDLDAVTRTFSFGRIQGRLDGDVKDLQLVAWQPDQFDLHLYTPPDDSSRRRISQRAVENLTELGSGVPAGLSASVLRIFEEFSYRAIDVKILLRGDSASIDGLARPDGGYYLVRGSGLPRIDVIGRNRSVAWSDLLERLREIQVEGVKIE